MQDAQQQSMRNNQVSVQSLQEPGAQEDMEMVFVDQSDSRLIHENDNQDQPR